MSEKLKARLHEYLVVGLVGQVGVAQLIQHLVVHLNNGLGTTNHSELLDVINI